LNAEFAARRVHKRYVAVVEGLLKQDSGAIEVPLAADWPHRPRQVVDLQRGKPALTHWRVLARAEDSTRLELEPVTGRSHQLRVHLQSIGHPIVGDRLYSAQPQRSPRLLLHACRLAFTHPARDKGCLFESPPPY
jgi:tRNA pseudouridine32 synthase/23S rRNA pseudouridine746 synthase